MKNFFRKRTKAEVLSYLSKKKLFFKIPKTYYFDISQWKNDKNYILNKIIVIFKNNKANRVAVRSSSIDEDNEFSSNAGKFYSELNIPLEKKKLIKIINKTISSYKKNVKKSSFLKNQILIQEMITDCSMSGVIFTKDKETSSNYYSINYDDVTGLTNTVTSGHGKYSNKTLFIYRNALNRIRSKRFKVIIKAVKDLEIVVKSNFLDIEFCITKKLVPYLLQVRRIASKKPINFQNEKNEKVIDKKLNNLEKDIKPNFKRKSGISGKTTIFGQMPDWNPVEMIGQFPNQLAFTLYSKLITNKIWAKARNEMGYKNLSKYNLMLNFAGQPFIDVRLSLNSFLPKNLNKKISDKLINFSIQKLISNPMFHDKIEFDISMTSYSFDFNNKFKTIYENILNKKEKKIFKTQIQDLTIKNVSISNDSSLKRALFDIDKLDRKHLHYRNSTIKDLKKIIFDCKKYGTYPFSILARHAFIATDLINSLKDLKIINNIDIENFRSNLNTITSQMLEDTNTLSKKVFLGKYGHLRPGTYDINSTRYDKQKNFKINKKNFYYQKKKHFKLTSQKKRKIDLLIKKNNFNIKNSDELFQYISDSITSREYAKFIFTKSVSLILELITSYGLKNKIDKENLSNIPISFFLDKKNFSKKNKLLLISKKNKYNQLMNKSIRLPQLIHDLAGIKIVPFQVNTPNFISHKKVQGNVIFLDNNNYDLNIQNKIIMIDNADPGFDWIFSHRILGLVTKYGGVNSHMAIRCAELGISAAIGCGEKKFEELKKYNSICLDCSALSVYGI